MGSSFYQLAENELESTSHRILMTILVAKAGELVSQGQCRSISSVSVMKMAFKGQGQKVTLNCKSYQNAAGIAQEKDYYLNGQYHWHVKRALISTDQ